MQSKKSIKGENLKLKEHSGITLIALVITIIVLLILAGVVLATLTGDSGILNNAESAKEKTNLANMEEQIKLAAQGALLEEVSKTGKMKITADNLQDELNNIVGKYEIETVEKNASWIVTVGEYRASVYENGSVSKALPRTDGTTPWLPDGFSQVEGTDLSNGLTITNSTGLQNYVWIEVPTTEQTIKLSDGTEQTINLGKAKTNEEIIETLELYAGKGTEQDYTKGSSSRDWADEWYDSKGSNVATDANKEDTAGCGMTYDQYENTYKKMLNSIQKYGGFWLAQYEAGIAYEEGNRTADSERISDNPTSANYAKDQYPYQFVYCSEAQKIANADSTDKYTSSLPFGIQWDLVCKFLEVKKAKTYSEIATNSTWGNYTNTGWTSSANSKWSSNGTSFTAGTKTKSSGSYLLTTGAITIINSYVNTSGEEITLNTTANPMNIYDFAGNVWEWTLEHGTSSGYGPCGIRGGGCDDNSQHRPAACRASDGTNYCTDEAGFRSVLY